MTTLPAEDALASLVGRRILVTGASGFIGSRLTVRLAQAGAHVIGLCRNPAKALHLAEQGIELFKADITDAERLESIVSQQIDIVMHLAAWMRGNSYSEADRVNRDGTRCLAELCAQYGVERFVYVSSIAVYGLHGDIDVDETSPVRPYHDPYGDSKIRGESVVQDVAARTGLSTVIVRPGMVYGPGSPGWTKRMVRWARLGRMPLVDGGAGMAYPIYIDNLLDLLLLCAAHPSATAQIFNAVDDGPVTLAQFGGAYMRMVPTRRAVRLPGWLFKGIAAVANPFMSQMNLNYLANQLTGRGQVFNHKAKVLLGWEPQVTFDEGMRRSEAWLREEGIL